MNIDAKVLEIEELIRAGQRDKAASILKEIKITAIPRHQVNPLANLSRRAGKIELAWKIISPIIRPKVALEKPATNEEKATYAIILLGLGARPEAFDLLETADEKCADVSLALAYAHMNSWDYLAASQKLKAYLKSKQLAPYQRMIAQVNLAASYVAIGNAEQAQTLLTENLEITQKNGWDLLFRNSLEISAQLAVQQKNWKKAEEYLNKAGENKQTEFYLDHFFVKKWKAIMTLQKENGSAQAINELDQVRELAEKNKHWETLRDCDYYKAIVTQDQKLAMHLYFGTPFASYRKRLTERGRGWLDIPTNYQWPDKNAKTKRIFDISHGEELGGQVKMKPGTALHKVFVALTSDFYRPFSIGNLHSLVYPKEFFNPDSSPKRVAFLIQRLREWFKENDIPMSVQSENDGFKLHSHGEYAIVLGRTQIKKADEADEPESYLVLIKKIKLDKKSQPLKATDIADFTQMSVRSVRYFLKWGVEKNKIQKVGTGRDSRYKFR